MIGMGRHEASNNKICIVLFHLLLFVMTGVPLSLLTLFPNTYSHTSIDILERVTNENEAFAGLFQLRTTHQMHAGPK
jgi:hypothetical protein